MVFNPCGLRRAYSPGLNFLGDSSNYLAIVKKGVKKEEPPVKLSPSSQVKGAMGVALGMGLKAISGSQEYLEDV